MAPIQKGSLCCFKSCKATDMSFYGSNVAQANVLFLGFENATSLVSPAWFDTSLPPPDKVASPCH